MLLITFVFLAALFAWPTFSYAQKDSTNRRVEIGAGLASLWFPFTNNFIQPSISVKYKVNKNVLRTGLNYYTGVTLNAGYERILFGNRFQAFAGADLIFVNESWYTGQRLTMVGIGPVIGLEYHVSPRFFLQTETSLTYGPGKLTPDYNGVNWRGGYFTAHRWLSLHAGITLFK